MFKYSSVLVFTFLTFGLIMNSCKKPSSSKSSGKMPKVIEYVYRDAPIAPQYYRSYTIGVSETEIKISVSSYEKVLGDTILKSDKATFEAIWALTQGAKVKEDKQNKMATGTSAHAILFESANEKKAFLSWNSLDTPNTELNNLVSKIHSVATCLDELKQRPLPKD